MMDADCPFCGGSRLEYRQNKAQTQAWTRCEACGAAGPHVPISTVADASASTPGKSRSPNGHLTKVNARAAWNARVPHSHTEM